MDKVRFTLVTDGSSDKALLAVLRWLVGQHASEPFEGTWADLARLRRPPGTLAERISMAADLYPCDLLFVHRDAETKPHEHRVAEIRRALESCTNIPPVVCVVPVRMQEAWLLFDEKAIRIAADCPNGKMPLALPELKRMEKEPDPKRRLHETLLAASGKKGRRAKSFRPRVRVHRLADIIDDFSPLRELPAFCAAESNLRTCLKTLNRLA